MTYDVQQGQGAQALDTENLLKYLSGDTIVSGATPSAGSGNLEVDIGSGTAWVDGSEVAVSSTTKTLSTGASNPRKDVIHVDSGGTVNVTEGTAEAAEPSGNTRFDTYKPAPPDLTSTNEAIIAEVWVASNKSDSFTSADIRDRRVVTGDQNLRADLVQTGTGLVDGQGTQINDFAGSNLSVDGSNVLNATGGLSVNQASSNTTTSGDGVYLVDTSGGAVTLTLSSTDASNEESIGVVNISGANAVTVDTEGSETIDPGGASSKTLSTEGWLVWFNGDGTNWDSSLDVDVESVTTDRLTINHVAARVEKTGTAQSISNDSTTKVDWDNTRYEDTDVLTVDLTNDEIDIDVAGTYAIIPTIAYVSDGTNWSTGDLIDLRIQINGSLEDYFPTYKVGTAEEGIPANPSGLELSVNDTISIHTKQQSGATINLQNSAVYMNLEVFRVG